VLRRKEISRLPPHEIAAAGVAYVPEDRRIFRDLTARDNLLIAARQGRHASSASRQNFPRCGSASNGEWGGGWDLARVWALFPALADVQHHRGDQLSGGQQKMLAIGRALMSNPDLLLLDEPSEGLAPAVIRALADAIGRIRAEGVTILLAEQNAAFATRVADRVYIIENGHIPVEEESTYIRAHPEVLQRYLAVEDVSEHG
jgi:branched-chain amino acid transport system ATP-binding protein